MTDDGAAQLGPDPSVLQLTLADVEQQLGTNQLGSMNVVSWVAGAGRALRAHWLLRRRRWSPPPAFHTQLAPASSPGAGGRAQGPVGQHSS